MISPAWCRMMAAYNSEMNRRFYAAAATLDEAARQQPRGAFFGSLHGTLCHLLWADATWMARLDGGAPPAASLADSPLLHADFAPMPAARAALDARIEAWAEGLDEAALQSDLTWHSQAAGRSIHRPMALVVTHFFNHQTHHRGQAHALLTAAGASTGDTDLPLVLA
ncbi:DinB family protein [Pseudoroseomonas cervicalis]|uniref:DinB family protein n=1 Tax=Teichococcus cervicalis TaxID=204525 RepID=UPI0027888ECA|nr:DinB family protein [Pseudoroseomonas cervicalis]MDQ1079952.1 putative damage-inducible protein DinB [Pseudoroseomonas cervicalis]